MTQIECDFCGKFFNKKPSRIENTEKHFCSQDCYGNWQSENRSGKNHHQYNRKQVECKNCGEKKEVTQSHHKQVDNHYCDAKCQAEHEDRSGKNSPSWDGGKITVTCEHCGDKKKVERYRYREYDNFFCDVHCRGKWATNEFSGENHPLHENYTDRYGTNWLKIRDQVRERDNGECQLCGITKEELGKWPDTHHIIPKKKFDSPEESNFMENLVLLCSECHGKVEQEIVELNRKQ